MKTRKQSLLLIGVLTLFLFASCERDDELTSVTEDEEGVVVSDDDAENVDDHDASSDYTWDSSDVASVTLSGSSISSGGSGLSIDGSTVTITSAGTYSFTGTLNDGQIIVDTEDETIVRLILSGIDISCSNNAPIYIENAEKAMIVLADNTQNTITDGASYSSDEEDANAAIFSKQNFTIYGEGSLTVNGNYNDGITSKDGLIITSGNITVDAVDDGIRGKDYLVVNSGDIEITCGGDGLKADNVEDEGEGYITINDGTFNIDAGGDAVYGGKDILIVTGELELISGGGSDAYLSSDASAKGLKSGLSTIVYGGTISVDAADDGIHSDGDIEIYGGTFYVASGDDGIHSEYDTNIETGDIYITESYEGLESAGGDINIADGYISIISSDDGINVSAGGTSSGGWHKSATTSSSSYALNIFGGYIAIDCSGDGLDSNGDLAISGGTQLVNGPSSNSNSALDYDGSCVMNAGFLVAVGSSQMSEAPGSSSSQYSFLVDFKSQLSGGDIIHVEDADGNNILTFEPHKAYQSIAFSSSDLKSGTTYKMYVGGSSSGTATNGLYSSGTYSGGTLYTEFTISSIVTTINL